tara:strand:- start:47 stop:280 length:234 start_codon:yes stop_codon:yes gene_type:complete
MWIRDNIFEYKIASNPTKKDFEEITKIIAVNNYTHQEIEAVRVYCASKNPIFNEDIFYNKIESNIAMLDEGKITNAN